MTPRAISYKNYFVWVNPQSRSEATVGIGCETKNDPGELYEDMSHILRKRNIEPPSREDIYIGTVASSSLLSLGKSEYTLNGSKVYLVGD